MKKKIDENNTENTMLHSSSSISLNDFFLKYGVKRRYIVTDKTTKGSLVLGRKVWWSKEEAKQQCLLQRKQTGKDYQVFAEYDLSKTPLAIFDDDKKGRTYEDMVIEYPECADGLWTEGNTKGFHIVLEDERFVEPQSGFLKCFDRSNDRDLITDILWVRIDIKTFQGEEPIRDKVIIDKILTYFTDFESKLLGLKLKKKKKSVAKDEKEMSVEPIKVISKDRQLITELIESIDIRFINTFDSWYNLCCALNCCDCADLIDTLSSKGNTYQDASYNNIIDSIKSKIQNHTIGTIKHYSKESNLNKYYEIVSKYTPLPDMSDEMYLADDYFAELFLAISDDVFYHKERDKLFCYDEEVAIWKQVDHFEDLIYTFKKYVAPYLNQEVKKRYEILSKTNCNKQVEFEDCGHCENCKIKDKLPKEQKQLKKAIKFIRADTNLKHIAHLIELNCKGKGLEVELDSNPWLFCWENKTFDIKKKEFIVRNREHYITHTCGYSYVEPPNMDYSHLHDLFVSIHPNEDVRKCYGNLLRNGLTRNLKEKITLANGTGGNGKSMINEFTGFLCGKYYHTMSHAILTKEITADKPLPEIAMLEDKRFCVISEIPSETIIMDDSMKKITNKEVNARKMRENDTKKRNTSIFILECNTRPKINVSPEAMDSMLRRYLDVEFQQRFTKDENLIGKGNYVKGDDKFKTDEWKIDNRILWFHYLVNEYEDEIYEPKIVKERSRKFLNACDTINELYKDCFVLDEEIEEKDGEYLTLKEIKKSIQDSDVYKNMDRKERTSVIKLDSIKNTLKRLYPLHYKEYSPRLKYCGKHIEYCVWGLSKLEGCEIDSD